MGLLFRGSKKGSITDNIPIVRFFGPTVSLAGMIAVAFLLVTGRIDLAKLDQLVEATRAGVGASVGGDADGQRLQPVELAMSTQKSNQLIRVATFNIQIFGKKKASDQEVMKTIAEIMLQFDVIAIQEVRGGDATPIRALIDLIQASGGRYAATISEPIGRTSQTESYAFVWDESRIQFIPNSAYVVQDPADRIHREPMVASFEARVGLADGRKPFRFTLVNVHTSPSEVVKDTPDNEMNVLDDVFVSVRQYDYQTSQEDDCILLGDLNVDVAGLRELGQIPGIESVGGDILTNTRRTKTYDHILMDRTVTREFTGRFGVLDLQRDMRLSEEQALRVSDHQPVWAEFSAYEMPRFAPVAGGNRALR